MRVATGMPTCAKNSSWPAGEQIKQVGEQLAVAGPGHAVGFAAGVYARGYVE
jgi:hypothetical protein